MNLNPQLRFGFLTFCQLENEHRPTSSTAQVDLVMKRQQLKPRIGTAPHFANIESFPYDLPVRLKTTFYGIPFSKMYQPFNQPLPKCSKTFPTLEHLTLHPSPFTLYLHPTYLTHPTHITHPTHQLIHPSTHPPIHPPPTPMNTLFFRLLDAEDKGTALQEAVAALPQNPTPEAFAVNPGVL
jgi:hypothetical protein